MSTNKPNNSSPPKPWEKDLSVLHSSSAVPTSQHHISTNIPQSNQETFVSSLENNANYTGTNNNYNYRSLFNSNNSPYFGASYGNSFGNNFRSYGGSNLYRNNGYYGNSMFGRNRSYNNAYSSPMYETNNSLSNFTNYITQASRSAEPTFELIENIVQLCNSFSYVMESTFSAAQGTFNAILSLVESFVRLRHRLVDSSFLKLIRFLWRRVVSFLTGRKSDLSDAWSSPTKPGKNNKPWPILLFLAVVIGGPMYVLSMVKEPKPVSIEDIRLAANMGKLRKVVEEHTPSSSKELGLSRGSIVTVLNENIGQPGWVEVQCQKTGNIGLYPEKCLIQPHALKQKTSMQNNFKQNEINKSNKKDNK